MSVPSATPSRIDETLLVRAASGDRPALAQVFQYFRPRLKHTITMRMDARLCGRIDPSDVIQETYLDAVRRIDQFKADRIPLLLWFRLLAVQRLVDLHRQHLGAQMRDASLEISLDQGGSPQASSIWLAEQIIDQHGTGSDAAIRAEVRQQVQDALDRMDPLDREVLAMRHFEMLGNQEVAMSLGISSTAASNRYIRALRRLKDVLAHKLS